MPAGPSWTYLTGALSRDLADEQGVTVGRPASLRAWITAYATATAGTADWETNQDRRKPRRRGPRPARRPPAATGELNGTTPAEGRLCAGNVMRTARRRRRPGVVRFILELIIGVAVAAIVTAAVMVTMFYYGPWADPPGMDELWWLLSTAAALLASWRWWARRYTP